MSIKNSALLGIMFGAFSMSIIAQRPEQAIVGAVIYHYLFVRGKK